MSWSKNLITTYNCVYKKSSSKFWKKDILLELDPFVMFYLQEVSILVF